MSTDQPSRDLVHVTSRPSPALECVDCGRVIPSGAVAFFWSNYSVDEPSCARCVATAHADDERGELDAWFWGPWTCETCHRPVRGRPGGKTTVCSTECRGALRTIRRQRQRASPWELDCHKCGERIAEPVVYGVHDAPRAPHCEPCARTLAEDHDRELRARYGANLFGLALRLPEEPGYDPFARRELTKCPVCGRGVRGSRSACCEHCESQRHNVVRRVEHEQRACAYCGEPFTPKRADAVYCSNAHRQAAYRQRVTGGRDEGGEAAGAVATTRNEVTS